MFNSTTETVKFKLGYDSNADSDGRWIGDEASPHVNLHHLLQSPQTIVVFRKRVFEGQKSVLKTEVIDAGC